MEAQGLSSTDGIRYTSAEALEWLRGGSPTSATTRCAGPPRLSSRWSQHCRRVRSYSTADLELILISNRLQDETRMRYENLTLLILDAQSEGRNVIEWFQKLIDRSRSKHRSRPAQAAHRLTPPARHNPRRGLPLADPHQTPKRELASAGTEAKSPLPIRGTLARGSIVLSRTC